MFGLDFSSPLALVCGFGVICCVLPLLVFLVLGRLTAGRLALLPMVMSFVPLIANEVLGWFLNRGDDQPETQVNQVYDRVSQRGQSFKSRIQSLGGGLDAQNAQPGQPFPQSNDPLAPPQQRSIRGGKRGPSPFGRQQGADWGDLPGVDTSSFGPPEGEDLLGPASVPGLRGRDPEEFDSPRRPRRDKRGSEQWDDEAFGGLFDDDGDGFSDY